MAADIGKVLVAARGVTVSFAGVDVLKSVDLDLRGGEVHVITGENGAGKSSLAKVLAGVYQPRLGSVEVDGVSVKMPNPREALRHGIALIHQEPLTFPELTVAENILVGHHPKKGGVVDWRGVNRQAQGILDSLGLNLRARDAVSGLSVAKQQMVELACALSHKPRVWIFDETTAPLTPKEAEELFVVIRRLRDEGCAIAMVTHHLDEIQSIADRVTVLRDGVKVAERLASEVSVDEIIRLMVGRDLASERFAKSGAEGATVLELKGLSGLGFADVSLSVRRGEVVCLAGLVGAGRTELARCLFGITRPTAGQIFLDGVLRRIGSPQQAIKCGIGLVPEDRQHDGLATILSVSFNATLARLSELSRGGFLSGKRLGERTSFFAQRFGLVFRSLEQPVEQLSGGNQQKVVLSS
jgi:ABC-type sugar transport system ATPase subunit